MNDQNPYTTPDASLAVEIDETYQPTVFSFSGRIGRLRYLAYLTGVYLVLAAIIIPVMAILGGLGLGASGMDGMSPVVIIMAVVLYVALLVFVFTLGKRRMNDLNRSGWWMLLFLVPLANMLLGLYMLFGPGTPGSNDFGPAPVANPIGVKILGLVFPVIGLIGIVAAIAIPAYQDYLGRLQ